MTITLEGDLDSWLQEIKPYQRETISALLSLNNNNLETVAEIYLYADGANNTVKFGGISGRDDTFFNRFKKEVKSFVCGDPKYSHYHDQIKIMIQPTKAKSTIATLLCSAISKELCVSVVIIYPVGILLLASIVSIGINTYCSLS
jgi:hypothetical protein